MKFIPGKPKGFGMSKHRKARVLKFSNKNPDSKKAWGGPKSPRQQRKEAARKHESH